MKHLRNWVPVLGALALGALFLKLPETPSLGTWLGCKSCGATDPYMPLFGAAYFAALVAISILFPAFPGPQVARGGLTWAVLLAGALTYLAYPAWCALCLIGHACNILIWLIWVKCPPVPSGKDTVNLRERLCLVLFSPICIVALFSCLNLTFMAYGLKAGQSASASTLKPGDTIPSFSAQTHGGRIIADTEALRSSGIVLNFVTPDCPYCKQELPILEGVATKLASGPYRFINVSSTLSPELLKLAPATEWIEDKNGSLRELFQVSGYPVAIILGKDGKIAEVLSGVPEKLDAMLLTALVGPAKSARQ